MNLAEYQEWYIRDEGHWYVSKVKQYNPVAVQLFAKSLKLIDAIINCEVNDDIWLTYHKFRPQEIQLNILGEKRVFLNDYSKLFICLNFLQNDLIDLSHLESTNKKKFKLFSEIQKEFIEGKDYNFFVNKYGLSYLKKDLMIYYRNFKSWLGKFGFYGEYGNKTSFITDAGLEFLNNSSDIEISNAIFLNQIKKYQLWNPTIDEKYKEFKVRPYYLLLEILLRLDNYFSKEEYVLFITKIKSHQELEISNQVTLIKAFRALEPEKKKQYVEELIELDKRKFKKRKRTHYERLKDSAPKEIACYGYGGNIEQGKGRYVGTYVLSDKRKAENEMTLFTNSTKFVEFKDKLAWISHLGSLEGISLEAIVEMYIDSGMSIENIKAQLGSNVGLANSIEDKIYEKEIEEYYVNNIKEINENLVVIKEPSYGRQFSTHIGPIDILCIDKKTNEYVICELKRGQTSDETVGQLLRYMGWVYEHLANYESNVKGILVGSDFDKKLDYSLKGVQNENIYSLVSKYKHPFNDNNRPK